MKTIQNRSEIAMEVPITLPSGEKTSFFVQPKSRAEVPDTYVPDLSFLRSNESTIRYLESSTGRPVDLRKMIKEAQLSTQQKAVQPTPTTPAQTTSSTKEIK